MADAVLARDGDHHQAGRLGRAAAVWRREAFPGLWTSS